MLAVDLAALQLEVACDDLEDGALARAILPDDRQLGVLTYREIDRREDGLALVVGETDVLKPEDDIAVVHTIRGDRCLSPSTGHVVRERQWQGGETE